MVTFHFWYSLLGWLLFDDGTHRVRGYSGDLVLLPPLVPRETWYSQSHWVLLYFGTHIAVGSPDDGGTLLIHGSSRTLVLSWCLGHLCLLVLSVGLGHTKVVVLFVPLVPLAEWYSRVSWVTRVKWYSRIHWLRSRNGTLHALGSSWILVLLTVLGHFLRMVLTCHLVTHLRWYSFSP